jgi:hypothetical protein
VNLANPTEATQNAFDAYANEFGFVTALAASSLLLWSHIERMSMAKKKDPSITFLNKFGYNVIKLPRVGIEPLDVIGSDTSNQWLGPLRTVWKSTLAEPSPSAPRAAAAISGQKTDKLDVSFGLKILANALAAFGATVPSVDFAFTRARNVQFAYTDVTSTVVAPFDAGEYLKAGSLSSDNPVVKHYFLDPGAEAFLIVDVLKSASITVAATDEHGVGVSVDVPAIQGVVGANVSVKPSSSSNDTLTFSGKVPVSFGFIVDRIQFDGKSWSLSGEAPSGQNALGVGGADKAQPPAPILLGSGCQISLS